MCLVVSTLTKTFVAQHFLFLGRNPNLLSMEDCYPALDPLAARLSANEPS
jgi:hypothetical protein